MASILVLGGGRQGRVIAADLAADHSVTIADRAAIEAPAGVSLELFDGDLSGAGRALMERFDLVVGALPAAAGYEAAQGAIAAGRSYVDIAFYAEDAASLDASAREAGVAVLPDCGLAPGLSHLLAGRALASGPVDELSIYVGGVAADPRRPYGYVVTWSVPDLLDEYRRPARLRIDGALQVMPALSEVEILDIDGIGEMEAFNTDGLRTLLGVEGPRVMREKTLRWPGHAEAVKPLVEAGRLVEVIEEECREGDDLVVLLVEVDGRRATMIARPQDGMSAMARTTALTCAAFARWVARPVFDGVGVIAPEALGQDPAAYAFILGQLEDRGIRCDPARPFTKPAQA